MKKICCLFVCIAVLCAGAYAQEIIAVPQQTPEQTAQATAEIPAPEAADETAPAAKDTVTVGFEDGFTLELPADWLHYPVSAEMAAGGVLYCLSDAQAECFLYIQHWETEAADINALHASIQQNAAPQNSGVYNFNGTDFIVYDLTDEDVSCCATPLNGGVLNFVFSPQSNPDFMLVAATIISSFGLTA